MSKMQLTLMLKIVWHVRKYGGLYFKHATGQTMTPSMLNFSELFYIIRQRKKLQSPNFQTFKEPSNRFQGINQESIPGNQFRQSMQIGRPGTTTTIPTRFLAPMDCQKITVQCAGVNRTAAIMSERDRSSLFAPTGPVEDNLASIVRVFIEDRYTNYFLQRRSGKTKNYPRMSCRCLHLHCCM